jgi:hypothetical protein
MYEVGKFEDILCLNFLIRRTKVKVSKRAQ